MKNRLTWDLSALGVGRDSSAIPQPKREDDFLSYREEAHLRFYTHGRRDNILLSYEK
jgi:hypothetical protein